VARLPQVTGSRLVRALEALLRRRAFAREEDLRIDRRPPGAAVFGAYSTRR